MIDHVPGRLDPEVAAVLAGLPLDLTRLALTDLPALRVPALPTPVLDGVQRSRHTVPGDPDVVLHVHRPEASGTDRACLYWMHGGGLVMGSADGNAALLDHWSLLFDCVIVSVDYRLAPEQPYPGPLEDCYAGLAWTVEHAADLGIAADRMGVGGSSAGAGLAAAVALLARDRGGLPLAFQYLLHPMLDDRRTTRSSHWEDAPVWPRHANGVAWRAYLGNRCATDDVPVYAAPARAEDLVGLPPALVLVGSVDGFVDECVDFAGRLLHAGVPTDLRVYAGAPHGFTAVAPNTALARRAGRDTEEWLAPYLRKD